MNKKFKIPVWAIVLSFVFQIYPLGILLIILKVALESSSSSSKTMNTQYDKPAQKNPYEKKADWPFAAAMAGQTAFRTGTGAGTESAAKTEKKDRKKKYKSGKKGLFLTLFILLAAATVGLSIATAASMFSGISGSFLRILPVTALFCGGTGLMYYLYDKCRKKESEFNKYLTIVNDRPAINLSRLSLIADKNIKKVMQDMQRLIDEGYFGSDAYLDVSTNNFLSSPTAKPDAPGEYYFGYEASKRAAADAAQAHTDAGKNEQTEESSGEFSEYLKKLRKADDDIADIDVSDRIFNLEKVSTNIFTYVEDHPEKRSEIRKFVNYYLPTTLKLLESYSRIEKAGATGKNMQAAKANIESTLDKLVKGFEEQLDHLYQAEAMDISSDIDVLEQMMEQDGLSGDDDTFGTAAARKKDT